MWEFYLAKYDKYKKWIHERRDDKIGWEKIKYGLRNNESELSEFLSQQRVNNLWDIDIIEWLELIEFERKIEEESINIEGGITTEGKNRQTVNVEERPGSCWYAYKKTLKEKSFSESSINAIKESSLKILSQLKLETKPDSPIKGLVVGNVQSGKTANMGALISMAADNGW
ncbi:MAG TPA: endonuclease, partial [Bacilli bacterium]|nr:endonuclease [Bacilli bacterium]